MRILNLVILVLTVCFFVSAASASATGGAFRYEKIKTAENAAPVMSVVGFKKTHVIKKKETLLDISRDYGLGFNELELLYPDMDPWLPPEGTKIDIPVMWVPPGTSCEDVVINIPEMRLYRFFPESQACKDLSDRYRETGYGHSHN
ncbi:MAG: hypothetical protein ACLFUN_07505 [Desulfobacterales bacterium]